MPEEVKPADAVRQLRKRLSAYFPPKSVEWKPQSIKGNRALAVAYIDARTVMKRLDDVVGIDGWQDEYVVLGDGCVVCTLRVKIAGQWVAKEDVGGESDQKDVGDKRKASFSDAFKRAAVKFGVGRYLYSLPSQWLSYDKERNRFTEEPQLPPWALAKTETTQPRGAQAPAQAPAAASAEVITSEQLKKLDELLTRKMVHWPMVVAREGLVAGTGKADLTVAQWQTIVGKLSTQPDRGAVARE